MKQELRDRIINGETVDTRNYRYKMVVCRVSDRQWAEIRRIPIECLDTTDALARWETVEALYEA